MKKRSMLILGIVALILISFSLGTAQKSVVPKKTATPLPADKIVPITPPVVTGEKDYCFLDYTDWAVAFYFDGWNVGDKVAIYFDPEDCGHPQNYPFQLTDVEFVLYDFMGVGSVDVRFSVEVMCPDICDGPGIEIYKSPIYTITTFYPDFVTIDFPMDDTICLDKPFFFNLEYMSGIQGSIPSVFFDDQVVDTCYQWVWRGQPAWYEWYNFWTPPPPGWILLGISGYCGDEQTNCGEWYWKPDTTEAPSGMPDFDQYQFGPPDSQAMCGPTAVANCLWWFDAVPPDMNPPDFIRLLSNYFYTDPAYGTYVDSIQAGLDRYFQDFGFALKETTYWMPDFHEMEDSLKVCQDIILLLGYWWWDDYYQEWFREGGHYVTMAGVNSEKKEIAISDPARDQCVQYPWWPGRVRTPDHLPWGMYGPDYHNNTQYVSHDVYISLLYPEFPSPGSYRWDLADYCYEQYKFSNMNVPERFRAFTKEAPKHLEYWHVEVEAAIMICPEPVCTPSIDAEKKVWDETNGDWVDSTEIDSCSNAKFLITIHNDGTCCDLTNIIVEDFMDSSLEFLDAVPPPDIIQPVPGGTYLEWNFPGPLSPCNTIDISVTAHVVGPPCHLDSNYIFVHGSCEPQAIEVYDEDCAYVHATAPPWLNHKMHFPQLPDLEGWDVYALFPKTLADDWQCSATGPVLDIHFWGSWKDMDGDPYTDDFQTPMPFFQLSIHRNIPETPDTPWSRPGEQIWFWEGEVPGTPFEPPAMEHWFNPNTGEVLYNDHVPYWRYDFFFDQADPPPEPFFQDKDSIYWLNISAMYIDPLYYQWGWKSSRDHFMDDATYTDNPPDGPWFPLYEPPRANWFDVYFNSAGDPEDQGSTNYYGAGWYRYEYWWNMWFYNNPFVPNPKHIWLAFDVLEAGPQPYAEFAVNWSTDLWYYEGEPGRPPLPGDDETLYIGRQVFPVDLGPNTIDFWIEEYNPEWVSIDFVATDIVITGWIWHECVQTSMDLAFVITGEKEPCDPPNIGCPADETQDQNGVYTTTTQWTADDGNPGNPAINLTSVTVDLANLPPGISAANVNFTGCVPGPGCKSTNGTVTYTVSDHCQSGGPIYLIATNNCPPPNADTCSFNVTLTNDPPDITQPDSLEGYVNDVVEYDITGNDPNGDIIRDEASITIEPDCGSYLITRTAGHGTSSGTWHVSWNTSGCTACITHLVIHDLTDTCQATSYCTTKVHLSVSNWYWKPPYDDYAPNGMVDIDQRQDAWIKAETEQWSFCGPVAVANCFKWYDSKYNQVNPGVPGDGMDQFPLVRQYIDVIGGMICPWDDHDPWNVDHAGTPWLFGATPPPPPTLPQPFVPGPQPPGPMPPWGELVERLAWYFNTDGVQSGYCEFSGTNVIAMQAGIDAWFLSEMFEDSSTLADTLYERTWPQPTFAWVETLVEKCQDVILLLGFWYEDPPGSGVWWRIGGHYVTVAGVNSEEFMIAFSDPFIDAFEMGITPGRVGDGFIIPHPHGSHDPTVHNDEGNVCHDIYMVDTSPISPGGLWWLPEYAVMFDPLYWSWNFYNQNVPIEFQDLTLPWNEVSYIFTEVEYAIEISPWEYPPDCGDCNGDGTVNIADVVCLVSYLFQGGPPPVKMVKADVNHDGYFAPIVNIADIVYLVTYLFQNGPPPQCYDP